MLFGFPSMDEKKNSCNLYWIPLCRLTNFPLTVKAVNASFMPNPILLKGV